jgi:hypothetical protein
VKFLCLACDQPMRLASTAGPDEGSLTVSFRCPGCGHAVAMLTNPWETQLVRSLGVKVGATPAEAPAPYAGVRASLARQRAGAFEEPARGLAGEAGAATAPAPGAPEAAEGPGCPFAAMVSGAAAAGSGVAWTPEAEARVERIPAFVRPMARQAIERFARDRGYGTVTGEVLDEAREVIGL